MYKRQPENWSASYKFTVFEGSYIVRLLRLGAGHEPVLSPPRFHLARPLAASDARSADADFQLVWPHELDATLLDAVQHACDSVSLGAKRKTDDAAREPCLSTVQSKLRRLNM